MKSNNKGKTALGLYKHHFFYIKNIEVARGRSKQECIQGLYEAFGDAAVPYRTVAFREGRDAIQDNLHTGWPHLENNTLQLLAFLFDADCRMTARELALEVWVCQKIEEISIDIISAAWTLDMQRLSD